MRTKTLGQIAHETGERAGSWVRKWEHMHHSQRIEWEVLADAVAAVVAAAERERCALACLGLKNPPRDIKAPLMGIDVAGDVANAMADKCAAVIRGA